MNKNDIYITSIYSRNDNIRRRIYFCAESSCFITRMDVFGESSVTLISDGFQDIVDIMDECWYINYIGKSNISFGHPHESLEFGKEMISFCGYIVSFDRSHYYCLHKDSTFLSSNGELLAGYMKHMIMGETPWLFDGFGKNISSSPIDIDWYERVEDSRAECRIANDMALVSGLNWAECMHDTDVCFKFYVAENKKTGLFHAYVGEFIFVAISPDHIAPMVKHFLGLGRITLGESNFTSSTPIFFLKWIGFFQIDDYHIARCAYNGEIRYYVSEDMEGLKKALDVEKIKRHRGGENE